MNDGGESEWCMFGISVIEKLILFVEENKTGRMSEYVCDITIQCCTL